MTRGYRVTAIIAGLFIVVIIVIMTLSLYSVLNPIGEKTTVVPRITVMVVDEMTGQPIADVMISCKYDYWERRESWNPERWPTIEYEIGLVLTDSNGVATFDPPPIVEQSWQSRFSTITLTAIHPLYSDIGTHCNQYISKYDAPKRFQQPVCFRKISLASLPEAQENWSERYPSIWEAMSHMVLVLPDYADNMPRFDRIIDKEHYIALYRATLEQTCGTSYENITARYCLPVERGVQPDQVKYFIEEVARGETPMNVIRACEKRL